MKNINPYRLFSTNNTPRENGGVISIVDNGASKEVIPEEDKKLFPVAPIAKKRGRPFGKK